MYVKLTKCVCVWVSVHAGNEPYPVSIVRIYQFCSSPNGNTFCSWIGRGTIVGFISFFAFGSDSLMMSAFCSSPIMWKPTAMNKINSTLNFWLVCGARDWHWRVKLCLCSCNNFGFSFGPIKLQSQPQIKLNYSKFISTRFLGSISEFERTVTEPASG